MNDTKFFLKSKTFWFNILALVTIIVGQFGFTEFKPDAWVGELGTAIVLIINIILRFRTTQKISLER